MRRKRINAAAIIILGSLSPVSSQYLAQAQQELERRPADNVVQPATPVTWVERVKATATPVKQTSPKEAPADYILGADDQVELWTPEAEELNTKVMRVEGNGSITIPLVGAVKAAGLTPKQLSTEISKKLEKYYHRPQVVVFVTEYRSQPVSVFGAVNTPGVQQVQGRKTLVEMLSKAGGPRQDAGPTVVITRRAEWGPIPVEGATMDPSGEFSTAEIDLKAVTTAERPQDNIAVKPNDVITVRKARLVYVVGDVQRSGGFVLTERDGMSVLQALSMAGGLKVTASAKNARIIRKDESSPGEGKPVDLKAMLSGKETDFDLQPDDILYVPDSKPKKVGIRAAEAAIQMITGVAIWGTSRQRD
jgi:polysaccharide export outer membrane protein